LRKKFEGARRPLWRPPQPFAIYIFADAFKQLAVSFRDPVEIFPPATD